MIEQWNEGQNDGNSYKRLFNGSRSFYAVPRPRASVLSPVPSGSGIEIYGRKNLMAKRFTATEKWLDPWFRKLPVICKLFWLYLCDQCDNSGVWKKDLDLCQYLMGENGVEEDRALLALGKRVVVLNNEYWLLKDFINFQYGELSRDCKPHAAVMKLIQNHQKIGYPKGIHTLKDKDKDKDIDKEQDKDKSLGVAVGSSSAGSFPKTEVGVLKKESLSTPLKPWNEEPKDLVSLEKIEKWKKDHPKERVEVSKYGIIKE